MDRDSGCIHCDDNLFYCACIHYEKQDESLSICRGRDVWLQKGKGIEVNTSGYRDLKTCGFPNFEQVQRYYDLEGRIITIGTDSHTSERVGENCLNVAKKYQEIGFDDVSTFTQRKRD